MYSYDVAKERYVCLGCHEPVDSRKEGDVTHIAPCVCELIYRARLELGFNVWARRWHRGVPKTLLARIARPSVVWCGFLKHQIERQYPFYDEGLWWLFDDTWREWGDGKAA